MRIRILLFFLVASLFLTSCATQKDMIVAEYGDFLIPLNEFEDAYAKSVGGLEAAKADSFQNYKDFLDLYVNFKMKLRDAKIRGYNENPELQKEFKDYRDNLGSTYLYEKKVINPGVKKLYELRKNEIRASHILLSVTPEDEEDVYKKAKSIIAELKKGASFDSLAQVYSKDAYTKNNGGDVFYLVAGTILPVLEDAIYSLEVGEVYDEPVKTRFGYHIIKLTEKKPYRPSITARHILASVRDSNNVLDTLKSLEKIKEIKTKLENGEDFTELAKKYSDDKGSGANGGNLGSFGRRKMVRRFDEAAFNLKVGETSDIVKTQFGYHIIQVTGEEEYPTFEEARENLLSLYKHALYDIDKEKYLDSLKEKFEYVLNSQVIDDIDAKNDSIKFNNKFFDSELDKTFGTSSIFEIGMVKYTVDSLVNFAVSEQKFSNKIIKKDLLTNAVNKLTESELIKKQMSVLEEEDPEFVKLMDEYRNGLYIFKIQEEEVWKKLNIDSVKVLEYYEKNKNDYMWPERVDYSEIFLRDSTKAFALMPVFQSGADFETIAQNENDNPELARNKGHVGPVIVSKDAISKAVHNIEKEGDIAGPIKNKNGWSIVRLNKKLPPQIKSFEESKSEVMSAFQEAESKRLEKEYIKRLKEIYKPVKNYDELKNVFNTKENTAN